MADQELILRIRADMQDVQRKLRRLERDGGDSADGIARRFERAGRRISSAFRAIRGPALAAGAAGAGLAVLAQRSLAAAENIQDLADRADVSAEFLQELRFATNQSGASARDFDDAISRLNRRFGLFLQNLRTGEGEAGPAAAAFRALGLEAGIASGQLGDTESVFRAAVRELGNIESAAQRAALASQLFGEDSGPRLVGLIDQGTAGLERMAREARELGVVMSDELVANGARASDQLEILATVMQTRVTAAVVENAEQIDELAQAFTEALPGMIEFAVQLANAFKTVGDRIQDVTRFILGTNGVSALGEGSIDATSELVERLERARELFGGGSLTTGQIFDEARNAGFSRQAAEGIVGGIAPGFLSDNANPNLRRLSEQGADLFLRAMVTRLNRRSYTDTLTTEQLAIQTANERAALAGNAASGGSGRGGDTSQSALDALLPQVSNDLARNQPLSQGADAFLEQWLEGSRKAGDEIAKAAGDGLPDEFERNRDQISNSIQNGLRAAFDGNLLDFIKNNLQNAAFEGLANAITNAFASEKGTGLFGSIIGGLFGGGFGGPGKATGGPASGLTLVGEQGPELVNLGGMANVMTANMTRMAMSASKMTRGRGMTNVSTSLNIDARGAEVGVEERIRAVLSVEGPRLQRQAVEATISALNRSQRNTQVI